MSTPSLSKKILLSSLVALPFPYVLALSVNAVSNLPEKHNAMEFLSSGHGPSVYIATWFLFFIAAVLSVLLGGKSGSVNSGSAKNSSDDNDVDEGAETGTVKWFNVNKGFGFITSDAGEDVFVHFRSIRGTGRRSLRQGQSVYFDLSEGDKGLQADNVSVRN